MLHHALRAATNKELTLEFIASLAFADVSSSSLSATPQAGDLLVYLAGATSVGIFVADPTNVVPSGFTQAGTWSEGIGTNNYGGRTTIAYKIADGTEGTLSGMGTWQILQFRGSKALTTVSVVDSGGTWSTGNPAGDTISGGTTKPAVHVGVFMHRNTGSPTITFSVSGYTPEATNGTYFRSRYVAMNADLPSCSVDSSDLGDIQGYGACCLAVA